MLTIAVDGQLEDRLKRAASTAGADPQVVARRLLEEYLPQPNAPTLALLDKWDAEDATDNPLTQQRYREEGEELMQNLARNRTESEGPSARKLQP